MTTHLLYLHGFRSSPRSAKAQRMAQWVQANTPQLTWWCPQLPPSPQEAMALIEDGTSRWPREQMAVVGSSLGGFYATALAQRRGCRCAVINPAVNPARDLARYIGELTAWHSDDHFFFRPEYVDELQQLTPGELVDPSRYMALIATGDEVLDWREMSERYRGTNLHIVQGSDHALSDFDSHLPHLVEFLQLEPSVPPGLARRQSGQ